MSSIETIRARQILDSRGHPTIEVEVLTAEGYMGRAAVPSGASTGSHEACELRDGDAHVYHGKGVSKAIDNVHRVLAPRLQDEVDVCDQKNIDKLLCEWDGTPNKSHLGANALLAVSLACARAAAQECGLPLYRYLGGVAACQLPVPLMNLINGGAHADNGLDFQEFMVVPHDFPSFSQALRAGVEVFHTLKKILTEKKLSTAVGDEGGFAPRIASPEEALTLLSVAVQKAGYEGRVAFALDVAASSFFRDGSYQVQGQKKDTAFLIELYEKLCKDFPIVSIEDGLDENDWEGWQELTKRLGSKVQLVGDDLFVTNVNLLQEGIKNKAANSVLIKLNQIGTLSETFATMALAKSHGYSSIVSHRSGETEDTFIADLAVASGAGQIKTGSASRTDRMAKYNQLLRIEEELGSTALFRSPFLR